MTASRHLRTGIASCALVALVVGGAAFGLASISTAASRAGAVSTAPTHTKVFTSTTRGETSPNDNTLIQQSVDKADGKVIGYDVLTVRVNPKTDKVSMFAAFSFAGGQVFAKLRFAEDQAVGKILGGSGSYNGITGKVVADNISDNGKRSRVTLTYTK